MNERLAHQCHREGCDSACKWIAYARFQCRSPAMRIDCFGPTTIMVCDKHRRAQDVEEYMLSDRNKQAMVAQIAADGKYPPPDFESFRFEFYPIDAQPEAMQEKRPDGVLTIETGEPKPLSVLHDVRRDVQVPVPAKVIKCDRQECSNPAKFKIAFEVPPLGHAKIEKKNCIQTLVNLHVCNKHSKDLKVADFLTPEAKGKVLGEMSMRGLALPKFSAAKLMLIDIQNNATSAKVFAKTGIDDETKRNNRG